MSMIRRFTNPLIRSVPLLIFLVVTDTFGQQLSNQQLVDLEKYELASVVKNLMIDKASNVGFRHDYLHFKSLLSGIRLVAENELRRPSYQGFPGNPDDYLYVYEGKMPVFVNGQRLLDENMKDQYLWSVYFAGPKAFVSTAYILSEQSVRTVAGASYFSSAGLKLDPLSCDTYGGSGTDYSAYYKVSAPNKEPLVLGITKSVGSGGMWYSYEISWHGVKASTVGKDAILGICDILD